MRLDEKITILHGLLSQEELNIMYEHMENAKKENMHVHTNDGKITYFGEAVPLFIREKVFKCFQVRYDFPMVKTGHCSVRYKLIDGNQPILRPHTDTQPVHPGPKLSVSVQLRKNIDWPISVEGKSFVLEEGDAIIFSGTHQIHWRDPITFKEGDFLDVFLDSYSTEELQYTQINEEEKNKVDEKFKFWFREYNEKVKNGNSTNNNY